MSSVFSLPDFFTVPENDPIVQGLINNEVGNFLIAEMANTVGVCVSTFLNASEGEKVAFTGKTGSDIHKGSAKFDLPFSTVENWQGKPEKEGEIYIIQVSVSVFFDAKPTDALAVDVEGSKLKSMVKR